MLNLKNHLRARLQRAFQVRALLVGAWALGIPVSVGMISSGSVRCPVATVFHLPCPACGSTRAARALAHGHVLTALRYNPVAPVVLFLLVGLAARVLYLVARDGDAAALGEGRAGRALIGAFGMAIAAEIFIWSLRWFGLLGGPVPV